MQLRALKSESMETYKEAIHSTWGTSLMRYFLKFAGTAAEVKSEATTVPICKLANTKLYRIKRCSCYHTSDNHNRCSRWEFTAHSHGSERYGQASPALNPLQVYYCLEVFVATINRQYIV